jgi:succinoglycan biosynthesis transport protein ExoP
MRAQSLSEQEAKVQRFESQHGGALPTQEQSNLQILAGLQSQLQGDQEALNTAKQQRVYLQALLEQERTSQAAGRFSTGQSGASAPADLAAIDQQLDTLRTRLAELSSKYTDRYPDVPRLKQQIAKTELERQNLIAALKSKSPGAKELRRRRTFERCSGSNIERGRAATTRGNCKGTSWKSRTGKSQLRV